MELHRWLGAEQVVVFSTRSSRANILRTELLYEFKAVAAIPVSGREKRMGK